MSDYLDIFIRLECLEAYKVSADFEMDIDALRLRNDGDHVREAIRFVYLPR